MTIIFNGTLRINLILPSFIVAAAKRKEGSGKIKTPKVAKLTWLGKKESTSKLNN